VLEFHAGLRHLALAGSYNIRDVGGYVTRDGRTTRWRTLLRADSLHALAPESRQALLDYGVATIIDLRRGAEVTRRPNVFAGSGAVVYQNLPLFDGDTAEMVDLAAGDLDELYRNLLDHCRPQFGHVLQALAAPDTGCVLVHCMVGKDRTGLTIALALGAVGVPTETIADDYALSYDHLRPLFDRDRERLRAEGRDMARFERIIRSNHETMLNALDYLRQRYGGLESYLDAIGVTGDEIDRLKDKLLNA
jgi:protein-tyrosine phosphatase